MSGAHETLEHAEHAGHAGHAGGHHSSSKIYGVTMALIGVLIALTGALVGSERNELTRAMIEQTQAHEDYSGASTKFRLVMIELEKQHARIMAARDPQGAWSPVERFVELSHDYTKERSLSKAWADSYHPLVSAHFDAAEGYERAQLIAEIGIVMASLAVLLASRPAWVMSVVFSVLCVAQMGYTYLPTRSTVAKAEVRIHEAEEAYGELRHAHVGANQDEQAIDRVDPDGKIRAAIAARENGSTNKNHEGEAGK